MKPPRHANRRLRECLLIASLGVALAPACLADRQSEFDQANRAHEQGDFTGAISAYTRLQHAGPTSVALEFNLGNAFLGTGQVGKAVYHYLTALAMNPRDAEVRANLEFARQSIAPARRLQTSLWQAPLGRLTLNESTLLALIPLWISILLLSLGQLRPPWRPALRAATHLSWGITVICCLFFFLALYGKLNHQTAVVWVPEAEIRYGPFQEARSLEKAPDGTELRVIGRKDDWVEVKNASGARGWIQESEVGILPPG